MAGAAHDLAQVLEEQLELPIARNRTVVAATDRHLAGRQAKQLQRIGAKVEEAPTRLGMRHALKPTKVFALQAKRWGCSLGRRGGCKLKRRCGKPERGRVSCSGLWRPGHYTARKSHRWPLPGFEH